MPELLLLFTAGLFSAASPCLLPLYPGFIAYLASNSGAIAGRRAAGLLGLLVLAGVLTTMVAIGFLLRLLSLATGQFLLLIIPVVYLAVIALGVLLLSGRNPFEKMPNARIPLVKNPYGQAFVYGLMLGPVAVPCAGPFLFALLAISTGAADTVAQIGRFFVFGLGFGLPLVGLSLLAAARGQALVRWVLARHDTLERVAGVLLIAAGIYGLVTEWENIRFTLRI
ncbi:MAG: cytochrome c biogenesis protein CcdA [Chloroflexi bacterium]|nr:cytochrome c biogenesis protein CcdA [Chloroflexota bacterium]